MIRRENGTYTIEACAPTDDDHLKVVVACDEADEYVCWYYNEQTDAFIDGVYGPKKEAYRTFQHRIIGGDWAVVFDHHSGTDVWTGFPSREDARAFMHEVIEKHYPKGDPVDEDQTYFTVDGSGEFIVVTRTMQP